MHFNIRLYANDNHYPSFWTKHYSIIFYNLKYVGVKSKPKTRELYLQIDVQDIEAKSGYDKWFIFVLFSKKKQIYVCVGGLACKFRCTYFLQLIECVKRVFRHIAYTSKVKHTILR